MTGECQPISTMDHELLALKSDNTFIYPSGGTALFAADAGAGPLKNTPGVSGSGVGP